MKNGLILTRGTTAFNEKSKSPIKFEFGISTWSKFKMDFNMEDGRSTIKIYEITLVKTDGIEEKYYKLADDAADGKRAINGVKPGKARDKMQKEFNRKSEEINNTFYTVLALYKRAITN